MRHVDPGNGAENADEISPLLVRAPAGAREISQGEQLAGAAGVLLAQPDLAGLQHLRGGVVQQGRVVGGEDELRTRAVEVGILEQLHEGGGQRGMQAGVEFVDQQESSTPHETYGNIANSSPITAH